VTEIAAQMGINQNYLYRLLPRMESEGKLRREGKGWALPVG
jgi:DNA-binding IclR family transcriptional regulator